MITKEKYNSIIWEDEFKTLINIQNKNKDIYEGLNYSQIEEKKSLYQLKLLEIKTKLDKYIPIIDNLNKEKHLLDMEISILEAKLKIKLFDNFGK